MGLDVEPPEPPDLRGPTAPDGYEAVERTDETVHDDYRREELTAFLEDGAWAAAFEEWAEHTMLAEEQFRAAVDAGLVAGLDFYWEPATGDVGYRVPPASEALAGTPTDDADREAIEEELAELARTVSARLEDVVDRDGDEFGFFADTEGT